MVVRGHRPSAFRPDISQLARIVRALCAVAGRWCLPVAAVVAVTVAVSRGGGEGRLDVSRLCAWRQNPIPLMPGVMRLLLGLLPPGPARFLRAVGHADSVAPGRPLRLAYADPPYPGKAWLYRDHLDYGGEVDHAALLAQLAGVWRLGFVDLR